MLAAVGVHHICVWAEGHWNTYAGLGEMSLQAFRLALVALTRDPPGGVEFMEALLTDMQ